MPLFPLLLALASAIQPASPIHAPNSVEAPQDPPPASVCMRIASADAEPLLQYLAQRLQANGVTRIGNRTCESRTFDERSEVAWLDDDLMSMLDSQRSACIARTIGPNAIGMSWHLRVCDELSKPIDVDAIDPAAMTRADANASLEQLLREEARTEALAQLLNAGVSPSRLRVALRVEERRVGFALADASGSLLELAVHRLACREADLTLQWHELRLEIASDANLAEQAAAAQLRDELLAELAAARPGMRRDEPNPYRRAFTRVQQATWLPLRTLRAWNISALDAKVIFLLLASALSAAGAATLAIWRLRRQRSLA